MSHSIAQALASVADDDRAGLEAALEALPEPDLGACSVYALEVFGERPLVALFENRIRRNRNGQRTAPF